MLSTLNLKRAKQNDQIESSDQGAVAIAPAAEESCPAPDSRPSRDPSLRAEPRFTAPNVTPSDITASDFKAERLVPRVDNERLVSRVDTERVTPRMDGLFPSAEFPAPANDPGSDLGSDLGRVEDQPTIQLDSEPSGFAKAMKRALFGLVIMVGGAAATMGWQQFGDDARQLAKGLTPNMPLMSWLHLKHRDASQTAGTANASEAAAVETAGASTQTAQDPTQAADTPPADSAQAAAPPADQQAAAQQQATAPQPDPAPAAADTTPAPAIASAPSAEVTQLSQTVQALTREVASLQKTVAELKTNNEQMARDVAKFNERNTVRRAATPPRPATSPTAQVQRPAPPPPALSSPPPRPVSQYQPPARPYPVSSQEASAAQPRALPPPPPVVYSQQPTSPPPSYTQPRTYYSDPSGYADSSPAPRPPAAVP